MLTGLLQATEDGDKLSVDELLAQLHIIIVAGHDTTVNTMTLGVEALSRHPEALQYLYLHPDQVEKCIPELQRYVGMSGGQSLLASEDFEIHGKLIKKARLSPA